MRNFILVLFTFSISIFSQSIYNGIIILMSGEELHGKVVVDQSFFGKKKILLNDTTEFALIDVAEFTNQDGRFVVQREYGNFYGIYKFVEKGNLTLYKRRETKYSGGGGWVGTGSNMVFMPGGGIHEEEVVYFSKNRGKILEADYSNLSKALTDNAKSMAYLKSYKNLNYFYYGTWIAGLGLAAVGISKIKEGPNIGYFAAAGVILLLQWPIVGVQKGKIKKAVDTYMMEQ